MLYISTILLVISYLPLKTARNHSNESDLIFTFRSLPIQRQNSEIKALINNKRKIIFALLVEDSEVVTHYIQCLEKMLNPLTNESPYRNLIKSQTFHQNKLNLLQKMKDPLREFQKDFIFLREKKSTEIERNLSQILGYGLGSTPESDDIFIGILVAKYCLNKDIDETCKYLSMFPFERFTTPKSAQLIRKILVRNFPPKIISFIKLLKIQEEDKQLIQFELEARKIRTIGASSGYYFLLGVLWELENYQKGTGSTSRRIT